MIIQCISCSVIQSVDHNGTAEIVENNINQTIEDGWRYSTNYDGYVCPDCCKNGLSDGFMALTFPKIQKLSKSKSYLRLTYDMAGFISKLGLYG